MIGYGVFAFKRLGMSTRHVLVLGISLLLVLAMACEPADEENGLFDLDDPTPDVVAPGDPVDTPDDPAPIDVEGTVNVIDHPEHGQILADADGFVLYLFMEDEPDQSNCVEGCLEVWPPLSADDPIAGEGVDEALLGVMTREDDGSQQVTYNGWPLYYYAADAAPGDAEGQGLNDVWFVISPDGEPVMEPAGAAAS